MSILYIQMPVARLGVVDCLCTESIDFFQVTVHHWEEKVTEVLLIF